MQCNRNDPRGLSLSHSLHFLKVAILCPVKLVTKNKIIKEYSFEVKEQNGLLHNGQVYYFYESTFDRKYYDK